jgi:hypothetical protein
MMAMRDPQHEHQNPHYGAGPVIFGLAIASVPFFGALAMVTRLIGAAAIPIWIIAMGGAALVLKGPLGQAIARSLNPPRDESSSDVPAEVYAELDELRARLVELEERVDFSERLLTKGQEQQRQAP